MRTKQLIGATFIAFFLQALNYAISVAADRPSASGVYDVVIANGKIVDGSGNPWFMPMLRSRMARSPKSARSILAWLKE